MDTSPPRVHEAASPAIESAAPGRQGAAIYSLHPLLAGPIDRWAGQLDRIAGLGFDHVLIAPPFDAGPRGDLFLSLDPEAIDPRLRPAGSDGLGAADGIARIAEACRAAGLRLLLDLVLDRVAAAAPLAQSRPDLFGQTLQAGVFDPRQDLGGSGAAYARLHEPAAIDWWAARAGMLARAGVAGFRLLGLAAQPAEVIARLTAALRAAAPQARLMAWTSGMPAETRAGLPRFDDLFGSLPWWDFRAGWFWSECAGLQASGPLAAAAAAPFETAAPQDVAAARRAVRFAAGIGTSWLLPMGFEYGAPHALDPAADAPADWDRLRADHDFDITAEVAAVNAARREFLSVGRAPVPVTAPGSTAVAAVAVDTPDARHARSARIVLANAALDVPARLDAFRLLSGSGAILPAAQPVLPPDAPAATAGVTLTLAPGEVRWLQAAAVRLPSRGHDGLERPALTAAGAPRIGIEAVTPSIDAGRFPARRVVGETVTVEADVIFDGHDLFAAALQWRHVGADRWQEMRMRPLGNDRWRGEFPLGELGLHEYTVEAWRDGFATWRDEVTKKHAAGVDTHVELIEGRHLLGAHATAAGRSADGQALQDLLARVEGLDDDAQRTLLLADSTAAIMARTDPRPFCVRQPPLSVRAERPGAAFAAWYEIFPRSMSDDPDRHGNFDDVIRHLPRVQAMGFDVLYFPPIHPIGRANRKGRNNTLTPGPDDVGSPYAIGSEEGGHDALHRELGTLEDFRRLVAAAAQHGLELAIDFAVQCSPDHPWLREHPGWFAWRPDGSIKYAENPPKKYQDIVNVDFYAEAAKPGLWVALCEVVLFWCEQGVRLFRVDNPHTKPLPFWEWMIHEVQARFPDAVFLAEAFTRPKVMYRLAKAGFGQSYTYFTWRNTKRELTEYLEELTTTLPREFFRPHFFVNTPDINPPFLQTGGRAAHLIRAVLAATLSGLWGVYCGFELCEATPLPGREEYLDSEKYQIRAWDWQRAGNIVPEITALNAWRRENPALQTHLNVRFHPADNDAVLWYSKATDDGANVILVAVSLDPFNAQAANLTVPLWEWSFPDDASLVVEDLADGSTATWPGTAHRVELSPARPYAVWRTRLLA
jgi:starch synthase (maltosyl-transferring)